MCCNQLQNRSFCFYVFAQETTMYVVIFFTCWLCDTLHYRSSIHTIMTHFLACPHMSSIDSVSLKLRHELPGKFRWPPGSIETVEDTVWKESHEVLWTVNMKVRKSDKVGNFMWSQLAFFFFFSSCLILSSVSQPLSSYCLHCLFLKAGGRRAKQDLALKNTQFVQTGATYWKVCLPYDQRDE